MIPDISIKKYQDIKKKEGNVLLYGLKIMGIFNAHLYFNTLFPFGWQFER